jgi:hypothetical protein
MEALSLMVLQVIEAIPSSMYISIYLNNTIKHKKFFKPKENSHSNENNFKNL